MTTVTLIQNADHGANDIHTMTALPMNVTLTGLQGQGATFTCTNAFAAIRGAKAVDITYNAPINPSHQSVQVSSVQP